MATVAGEDWRKDSSGGFMVVVATVILVVVVVVAAAVVGFPGRMVARFLGREASTAARLLL